MADSTIEALGELMPTVPADINKEARAVAELGAELMTGRRRVFFYAGSGLDWQPLHRFSHLCDCFVYVDPRYRHDEFEQARQQLVGRQTQVGNGLRAVDHILPTESAYDTLTEATGQLAAMRDEPWTRIPYLLDRQPWGAVQRLQRHVGGASRDIWLVFIAGSPLIAYERLFIRTGVAPVILTLRLPRVGHVNPAGGLMGFGVNPLHGEPEIEQQWDALMGWDGEMGQLLRAHNAPLPKLVVADAVMEWRTHASWYRVPRWLSTLITQLHIMRNEPWPDLVRAPGGRRRVAVTKRPVDPLTARTVEAIVMDHATFHQYRWPDGLLVILAEPPPLDDEAVPDGPGVLNLDIGGIPLLRALGELERVCVERGISKIAVQAPLGFEDEADDLALWRQQDGQITDLTLHVDCDGQLLDYGRVADEVG